MKQQEYHLTDLLLALALLAALLITAGGRIPGI